MNNYHIYEEIGKGKYSVVYKGRKKKTIEYMAVKSLEKSRRTKLLNEVKMFTGLKHQNILKFYHWYETRNHLWVILEYCPGSDMMTLIEADQKGVNESIVLKFIRDIAQGLNYLHSKGIVFCDLKPSNILFNEYGVAKLADLGYARRLVDMISATIGPDMEITKRGSPYYMAPELFHDGGVYSFQSDLWALGCIIYELVTGQPPFQSKGFAELVDQILNADQKPLDVPIYELCRGLLDKEPTKRWGWDKICKFLNITHLNVPGQPHFETWCKKNPPTSRMTPSQLANNSAPSSTNNKKNVDIVRLSLTVHKNMLKEELQPTLQSQLYHKQGNVDQDVKLLNRDQEIQIGDEKPEEEDYENEENNNQQQQMEQQQNFTSPPNIQKPFAMKKDNVFPSTQSLINQSPIPGGATPQMKKQNDNEQMVAIDQLFTHSSDSAVKPIIGNREIEKSMETSFLKEQLPFPYISADDVNRGIDTDQIELHFENIYNYLANNNGNQNDKLNILNYFEQIIQASNVANRLLNSAFVPLILKLLKLSKLTQFKLRLCSILGLLIRHATVIEPEVSQVGIVECMVELLNSKEQSIVRRRAAAAFGEYQFYAATQMEEDPSNPYWEMTPQCFSCLIKVIKLQAEDEIVKFYCIKTIENISSQSLAAGSRFAQPEVVLLILQSFNATKNDALRVSCAVSLANLLMIDNSQVDILVQNMGLKNMVQIFIDNLSRVQQAMITIFNIYLLQSLNVAESNSSQPVQQVASYAVNKILMEESTLIKGLVHLLDHGSHVSRGKAAIALMLMIKFNITALLNLSDESYRFFQILDKSLRDNHDYLRQCLQHLVQQLCECTPIMIQAINDQLAENDDSQMINNKMIGNQQYLNVLSQYSQTACLQTALFSSQYLQVFTILLNQSSKQSHIQQILFNIMAKMCTNSKILIKQQQIIISTLLKSCIEYMQSAETTEIRFMFLKFIIELLSALLQEEGVYDYPNFLKPYANELNQIIISSILPLLRTLFQEASPLPFYGLKLASILLTYNAHFLPHFRKNKVLQAILDMYKPDGNGITGHTLNIIQKIVEGSSIDEISQLGILDKTIVIFTVFVQKNQEWAFEDISLILVSLSSKIITELQRSNNKSVISPDNSIIPQAFPSELLFFQDQFLTTLSPVLQLLNITSQNCQQSLLTYLLHLTYFYPGKLTPYRQQIFGQLMQIQQPQLMKKILKVLHWTVALNEQKPFKFDGKMALLQLLDRSGKEDKVVNMACKELPRYLI